MSAALISPAPWQIIAYIAKMHRRARSVGTCFASADEISSRAHARETAANERATSRVPESHCDACAAISPRMSTALCWRGLFCSSSTRLASSTRSASQPP